MRLVVDGETFEVKERPNKHGEYNCDWVSGPNPGYGFTCFFVRSQLVGTEPAPVDVRAELERAISDFLANIDPDTGYLGG